MADQVTANFGFVKPTPSDPGGASTWGSKLNANFDAIDTALQKVSLGAGSPSNKLQNPSFLVNQRSVSGTVSLGANVYGHDRWKGGTAGASYSYTTVGADVAVTIASGSLTQVVMPYDVDVDTMTLSASPSSTVQGRIYQTGATPPAYSALPVTAVGLSPGNAVTVEFSSGYLLQPQLEAGSTAHSFVRKRLALDTLECQALFEVIPYAFSLQGNAGLFKFPFLFRARKQSTPTYTNTFSSNSNGEVATVVNSSRDGFSLNLTLNSGTFTFASGVVYASSEP